MCPIGILHDRRLYNLLSQCKRSNIRGRSFDRFDHAIVFSDIDKFDREILKLSEEASLGVRMRSTISAGMGAFLILISTCWGLFYSRWGSWFGWGGIFSHLLTLARKIALSPCLYPTYRTIPISPGLILPSIN